MGPGFVMVVIVAAGIISVDMANIGTPAGGDLAPSVTGRYGNRLAGIQLHSSSRGELVCLFFVFVRRWFNVSPTWDYVFSSQSVPLYVAGSNSLLPRMSVSSQSV
jgi:hypothetical protein